MEKVRFEQAVSGLSKNLLLDKRRKAFQTKQFEGRKLMELLEPHVICLAGVEEDDIKS